MNNTSNTKTADAPGAEVVPMLVHDGQKEFDSYIHNLQLRVVGHFNAFGEKFETAFPDLKIKFDKEWLLNFHKGTAKSRLSDMVDSYIATQPHSLKEHHLESFWKKINEIMEDWRVASTPLRIFQDANDAYPRVTLQADFLPFNNKGRIELDEAFKCATRPLFDKYLDTEDQMEVLALMQTIADVYNRILDRLKQGKGRLRVGDLLHMAPAHLISFKEGVYVPNTQFINAF